MGQGQARLRSSRANQGAEAGSAGAARGAAAAGAGAGAAAVAAAAGTRTGAGAGAATGAAAGIAAALCSAVISLCHTREHSCLSNASEPSLRLPPSSLPKSGEHISNRSCFPSCSCTAGQETQHQSSRFCSYQIPPSQSPCQPNSPSPGSPCLRCLLVHLPAGLGFLPHLHLLLPCF